MNGQRVPVDRFYPKVGEPVEVDTQTQEQQMRILMMAGQGNRKPS